MTVPEQLAQFHKLRAGTKVLVADGSTAARASIGKTLKEMGIGPKELISVATYADAATAIEAERPRIILCEYHLGDRCGLSLAHHQREYAPGSGERLFILVTSNAREASVAEAAEEEVDSYILKPFTMPTLFDRVLKSASLKMAPDPYRKALEEGRVLLRLGKGPEAAKRFEEAVKLTEKPPLAFYYLGKAFAAAGEHAKAEEAFTAGLTFNDRHYRCLTGLYDLLVHLERLPEAYAVARKIIVTFPVNARKLDSILKLAARARIFEDMEAYYEIYVEMDYRTAELVRCMTAALGVAGMHFVGRNDAKRGVPLLKRSLLNSGRSPQIFREIVTNICSHGHATEAEALLREFPPDQQQSDPNFAAMDFLVASHQIPAAQTIDRGRKLLAKGANDPIIYEIMIRKCREAKLLHAAEALAHEGAKRWPELKDKLFGLLSP